MTSTHTSSAKYSNRAFYGYKLRSNWHILVLFIVLFTVAMIIPTILSMNGINEHIDSIRTAHYVTETAEETERRVANYVKDEYSAFGTVGITVSAILAVLSGMLCLSYVNDKKSVGCYHSFPVKRETIYFTETSIYAIFYLIAVSVGFCVTYTTLASLPCDVSFAPYFFTYMLDAVALFLVGYTMLIFIGGLSGTNPIKFILTGLYIVIGAALYALLVFMFVMKTNNINIEYYLNLNIFRVICAPVRFFYATSRIFSEGASVTELLVVIPDIVVCYIGGLFLHKYRKSERSGTSIVWKPVFAVTKYLVMFLSAMLGILIFGSGLALLIVGEDADISAFIIIRMIIGVLVGGFLAYMLSNALLYRSTKSIFKDFKGFLIFAAAMVVFVLLVPANITGLIGKKYPEKFTSKIELVENFESRKEKTKIEGELFDEIYENLDKDYSETEESNVRRYAIPDEIHGVNDGMTKAFDQFFEPAYPKNIKRYDTRYDYEYYEEMAKVSAVDEDDYEIYLEKFPDTSTSKGICVDNPFRSTMYLNVVQRPYFGIPLAKSVPVKAVGTGNKITRQSDFIKNINEASKNNLGKNYVDRYCFYELSLINGTGSFWDAPDTVYSSIMSEYEYSLDSRDSHPLIGHFMLGNKDYPLYADQYKIAKKLIAADNDGVNPKFNIDRITDMDKFYSEYADTFEYSALVNTETGEAKYVAYYELEELLPKAANLGPVGEYDSSLLQFMDIADSKYVLLVTDTNDIYTIFFREGAVDDTWLDDFYAKVRN